MVNLFNNNLKSKFIWNLFNQCKYCKERYYIHELKRGVLRNLKLCNRCFDIYKLKLWKMKNKLK